ncbi:hypothetical protein M501DRAFT_1001022 [Patellaria atrata CBS 101060]|uniref:Uncharacterized protein n=1 Tax=Patellaria atrata CBS 101060 TaxID=1346257 RepID=A0A9P4VVJ6_9PEZI|nr:hypothetical protein M501DRAFT_1001022 [Patellaria atrata CBS 101060]
MLSHVVKIHLSHIFTQFGQQLFVAIFKDPPRWLNVGKRLEDTVIFTEAMIHVVGCWTFWPWPTHKQAVPKDVLATIGRKLKHWIMYARPLTVSCSPNTMVTSDQKPNNMEQNYETWIVVSVYRARLVEELRAMVKGAKSGGLANSGSSVQEDTL